MLIVADKNIPMVEQAFSGLGDVQLVDGRNLNRADLRNADALLVRSITKVDAKLLEDTPVKFVGSATSGIDHIDVDWLNANGIQFAYTPGNNAQAVAEFVITVLQVLSERYCDPLDQKVLGVVGYGNIGKRLVRLAQTLGIKCLINDPFLQAEPAFRDVPFHSLEELLEQADIISLHTPLTREGRHPTHHLLNAERLCRIKDKAWLINSARGAVVDGQSLLTQLREKRLIAALDVWEGEPSIDTLLLQHVDLATPHIAGYSLEGKLNATESLHKALSKAFSLQASWEAPLPTIGIEKDLNRFELSPALRYLCRESCNIEADDQNLRQLPDLPVNERAAYFDSLRVSYRFRREFAAHRVALPLNPSAQSTLRELGFGLQE